MVENRITRSTYEHLDKGQYDHLGNSIYLQLADTLPYIFFSKGEWWEKLIIHEATKVPLAMNGKYKHKQKKYNSQVYGTT